MRANGLDAAVQQCSDAASEWSQWTAERQQTKVDLGSSRTSSAARMYGAREQNGRGKDVIADWDAKAFQPRRRGAFARATTQSQDTGGFGWVQRQYEASTKYQRSSRSECCFRSKVERESCNDDNCIEEAWTGILDPLNSIVASVCTGLHSSSPDASEGGGKPEVTAD